MLLAFMKRSRDPNQQAKSNVGIATGETEGTARQRGLALDTLIKQAMKLAELKPPAAGGDQTERMLRCAIFDNLIKFAIDLARPSGVPNRAMLDLLVAHAFKAGSHGLAPPERIAVAQQLQRAAATVAAIYDDRDLSVRH